jgi:hypothetical protein
MAQIAQTNSGLSSVQDLYDLINGKTTTTSGGDQTTSGSTNVVKTDQGISQESMNAMLQQILSGTQGLASVAQGQRTAGGYSSATNQMLINDLMTRSASQVAQANQSKTVTTVEGPKTVTVAPKTVSVGGATVEGVAKTAGTLGGLQLLANTLGNVDTVGKSSTAKGIKNWLSNIIGGNSSDASETVSMNPNETTFDNEPALNYSSGGRGTNVNADPQLTATANPAQAEAANQMANVFNETPNIIDNNVITSGGDSSVGSSGGGGSESFTPSVDTYTPETTYNPPDFEDINFDGGFADGGLVTKPKNPIMKYADGGQVTKKPSNLSTNQFAKVIDPRTGLIGTGTGINEEGVAQASATQTTTTGKSQVVNNPVLAQIPDAVFTSPAEGGGTGTDTNNGDSSTAGTTGGVTSSDLADAGRLGRAVGSLAKSRDMSMAGTALGLAGSPSLSSLGMNVANIATQGLVGQAANAYGVATNPGIANVTDLAMALANPAAAAVNAISSTLGFATIGEVVDNVANALNPNNPMSTAQQEAAQSAKDNPNSTQAAAEANQVAAQNNVDPLDALMDVTNAFGTAPSSEGGGQGMGTSGEKSGEGNAGDASGVGGDTGGTASAADGGHIEGAGGPIDDKIHTMLSDGEYVLSADTVAAIGVDKLDALQKKYHVPAAVQKLKGYARG